jgi:hypothetical protein
METKNKYSFVHNNKDKLQLLTVAKVVSAYNKILFKYTRSFPGKIAMPKTELTDIPKKYITIKEYLNSKPAWKQIIKFLENLKVDDINDYLDVMIRNWPNIAMHINMPDRKVPLSSMIFSLKIATMYDQFKDKEASSAKINKHLALKKTDDYHRLTPSLQSNINSLFKLKNLNSNLSFTEILEIFSGEFESEFVDIVKEMDENDITFENLSLKFK